MLTCTNKGTGNPFLTHCLVVNTQPNPVGREREGGREKENLGFTFSKGASVLLKHDVLELKVELSILNSV